MPRGADPGSSGLGEPVSWTPGSGATSAPARVPAGLDQLPQRAPVVESAD